jgi:phosphoglycolate phosphatase-like HAD superfamily hydrolase
MDSGSSDGMTLAFSLAALERLADPEYAFSDARQWSTHVGVVSDRPQHVAMKFTRDHQLPKHFLPRPGGEKEQTLEDVRSVSSEYETTERYVFVGTSEEDREMAEATGWEYVPLEEAAEAAGWELDAEPATADAGVQIEEDEDRDDWP